ncbi:MAG: tRNA lysidine(34) synthetase TilS, partial [candidate division WOR-3 bacterium]
MLNEFAINFLNQIKKTITLSKMFDDVNKAVIGFSAGPDSVCLLDVLKNIFGNKIDFSLVYVNHGLRHRNILLGEEKLTKWYAEKYKCGYRIMKIRIPETGKGIEAEARERRYAVLTAYAKKIGAQRIVLGHNLDDVIETFFLNLVRGSGTLGLQSIPAVRAPFVRPLIDTKKVDILKYLEERGLKFAVDNSNFDLNIRRNLIRHKIIPQLVELNPGLYETIKREIDILSVDEEFFHGITQRFIQRFVKEMKSGFVIDFKRLMYYNKAVKNRVIMSIIKLLKGDLSGIGSKHIEDICSLNDRMSGRRINLPNNLYAQKIYGNVFIGYEDRTKKKDFCISLKIDKEVEASNLKIKASLLKKFFPGCRTHNCEIFDFDQLCPPIYLRNWKAGDTIKIRNGRKRIKKVLNEARVPVNERRNIVLLCDQKGILWVVG